MSPRKGQATMNANGSAILIIIITTLIVLYILFLPPGDRAELLGESTGYTGGSGSGNGGSAVAPMPSMTLLEEQIGRISYINSDEREHPLPSFRIGTRTDGNVLKEVNSVYVKSSVFDSIIENISFRVDTELTSDLKLSFNVGKQAAGRLMIVLNGKQIMNDGLSPQTSQYLSLPVDQLQRYNMLTIGVSSPGWAFWSSNEYQLDTLQITGNVKDLSGAQARQTFILDEEELENLDRALLKFYADCEVSQAGLLKIQVNGRTVFSGYGDCGIINKVELDSRMLDWGENDLVFTTDNGNYLISNVEVITYLKEPVYPIYYFEVDERYFVTDSSNDAVCGEVDGTCPIGCSADADKDCCFNDGDNYWCDLETAQFGDRCVSYVTENTCSRCESGYEDDRGRAPEACEGLCGDDYDNDCPVGCSRYLDQDCCYEYSDDAYWCDDYPVGKPLSATCKLGVEQDERSSCPSRYVSDNGKRLSFTEDEDDPDELRSVYKVTVSMDFPTRDLKSATLIINGREFGLETYDIEWERDISKYVRPDTNSIQIEPGRAIDITDMNVVIEKR